MSESAPEANIAATPYSVPPPTPTPQSSEFMKAKTEAMISDKVTNYVMAQGAAKPSAPVRVAVIDGAPTVIPTPNVVPTDIGQIVPAEDMHLFGEEPPSFPACEFPGCNGEGSYSIVSGSGKPLSINRKGELVFGDAPPIDEYGMTAAERNRALLGVVGPSGAVGRMMPKCHVAVCVTHRSLPHAPKKPKTEHREEFTSYPRAAAAAHKIGLRTRTEPKITARKTLDGDRFEVVWLA